MPGYQVALIKNLYNSRNIDEILPLAASDHPEVNAL